jgi:hypothetical protein
VRKKANSKNRKKKKKKKKKMREQSLMKGNPHCPARLVAMAVAAVVLLAQGGDCRDNQQSAAAVATAREVLLSHSVANALSTSAAVFGTSRLAEAATRVPKLAAPESLIIIGTIAAEHDDEHDTGPAEVCGPFLYNKIDGPKQP